MDTLLTILSAIFGGGWLAQFVYYRIERRKRNAEVKNTEIDIDEKEDRLRDERLLRAYGQITSLQKIVDEERSKWAQLASDLSDLKMELLKEKERRRIAEYNTCDVSHCPSRTPPRTHTKEPPK